MVKRIRTFKRGYRKQPDGTTAYVVEFDLCQGKKRTRHRLSIDKQLVDLAGVTGAYSSFLRREIRGFRRALRHLTP